jgi:hypothetical protein
MAIGNYPVATDMDFSLKKFCTLAVSSSTTKLLLT